MRDRRSNTKAEAAEEQVLKEAVLGIVGAMWGDDREAYEQDTMGRRDLAVILWALDFPDPVKKQGG